MNPDCEAERSALDWVRRGGRQQHFLRTLEARARRRRRRRLATAGAVAAVALMVGWVGFQPPGREEPMQEVPSAIVVQPARQVLPDGSAVELNEGAALQTAFTSTERRVILQRGVAHFDVAKAAKPFVVVAGAVEVRAVGTAFAVHFENQAVEVLVTEGRVATEIGRTPAAKPARSWLVDAGNRILVPETTRAAVAEPEVVPVPPAEMSQRLAWRVPRLEFNGTLLAEAIPVINRHSRVQLRLGDERVGGVELGGVLRADNIEPLLTMLQQHYGLEVAREGDVVTLRMAE